MKKFTSYLNNDKDFSSAENQLNEGFFTKLFAFIAPNLTKRWIDAISLDTDLSRKKAENSNAVKMMAVVTRADSALAKKLEKKLKEDPEEFLKTWESPVGKNNLLTMTLKLQDMNEVKDEIDMLEEEANDIPDDVKGAAEAKKEIQGLISIRKKYIDAVQTMMEKVTLGKVEKASSIKIERPSKYKEGYITAKLQSGGYKSKNTPEEEDTKEQTGATKQERYKAAIEQLKDLNAKIANIPKNTPERKKIGQAINAKQQEIAAIKKECFSDYDTYLMLVEWNMLDLAGLVLGEAKAEEVQLINEAQKFIY